MTTEALTDEALKGGSALLLQINRHPGWGSVAAQAVECGMEAIAQDKTHLTIVFFGRDLTPKRAEDARAAVRKAMHLYAGHWAWHQRTEAERKGLLGEIVPEPAFIPVRFSGEIGQFQNKTATHVHAVADPSPALLRFRREVIEAYPHKIPTDFGGSYRPHVTLAEGPAGSALKREARVPSGATNAKVLILKLGTVREIYSF